MKSGIRPFPDFLWGITKTLPFSQKYYIQIHYADVYTTEDIIFAHGAAGIGAS
jgi:hypothetical protein